MSLGIAISALAWMAAPVCAQEDPVAPDSAIAAAGDSAAVAARAERPRLLVTGIAGSTIYVSMEGDAPAPPSGRVIDIAGADVGPLLGRWLVLESSGSRMLTRFDGEPFTVTRGSVFYLASAGPALVAGVGRGEPEDPSHPRWAGHFDDPQLGAGGTHFDTGSGLKVHHEIRRVVL